MGFFKVQNLSSTYWKKKIILYLYKANSITAVKHGLLLLLHLKEKIVVYYLLFSRNKIVSILRTEFCSLLHTCKLEIVSYFNKEFLS